LGLTHRLRWREIERLLQLAECDIEQAISGVEFDAWWNGRILATRHHMLMHELLRPRRG
jgi:hypothetical protein